MGVVADVYGVQEGVNSLYVYGDGSYSNWLVILTQVGGIKKHETADKTV